MNNTYLENRINELASEIKMLREKFNKTEDDINILCAACNIYDMLVSTRLDQVRQEYFNKI